MPGEIQQASERYEARRAAAGLGRGSALTSEALALLASDLDLDYSEILHAQSVLERAATKHIAEVPGVSAAALAPAFWFDALIVGILLQQARDARIGELKRAVAGAIEDLEGEARMHFLRGDQIGERQEGRHREVEAAHRIGKRLNDRADELRKLIANGEETK